MKIFTFSLLSVVLLTGLAYGHGGQSPMLICSDWDIFGEPGDANGDIFKISYLKGVIEGVAWASDHNTLDELAYPGFTSEHQKGLIDQFCSDDKNKQIPLLFAMKVVSMEMNGGSKETIDLFLRGLRKSISETIGSVTSQ